MHKCARECIYLIAARAKLTPLTSSSCSSSSSLPSINQLRFLSARKNEPNESASFGVARERVSPAATVPCRQSAAENCDINQLESWIMHRPLAVACTQARRLQNGNNRFARGAIGPAARNQGDGQQVVACALHRQDHRHRRRLAISINSIIGSRAGGAAAAVGALEASAPPPLAYDDATLRAHDNGQKLVIEDKHCRTRPIFQ